MMKRITLSILVFIIAIVAIALAIFAWQSMTPDEQFPEPAPINDLDAYLKQGEYLVRAGDCIACHTPRGSPDYAGGRGIQTPFGTIYSPNITPDNATGIGTWTANDFWQALHHGKGKDGEFLYPAFPFTEYTKVTREDADAMFAYLQSIPAVHQPNKPHTLGFPYNLRFLLAGWRMLYFTPGVYREDNSQTLQWNRGAYLVQGLGHCSACHTPRNALGGLKDANLGGGLIPVANWYAPSLTSDREAGLGTWEIADITALLKTGIAPHGTAFGPMAEVVRNSLQYMTTDDINAMAVYLKSLPKTESPSAQRASHNPQEAEQLMITGKRVYDAYCVECHQANGKGIAPAYPPLDGNRAITMQAANNPIRIVLHGGFPPSTQGNPRPYGMPPFGQLLSDQEVAGVVSYIRNSWSNESGYVTTVDVNKHRATPLD
jgi:mono/diheme cytochrome c family protein